MHILRYHTHTHSRASGFQKTISVIERHDGDDDDDDDDTAVDENVFDLQWWFCY